MRCKFGSSLPTGLAAVLTAVLLLPTAPRPTRAVEASRVGVLFHFSFANSDLTEKDGLDYNAKRYGDRCTEMTVRELQARGFTVVPVPVVFDEDDLKSDLTRKGLTPVRLTLHIDLWNKPGTFKNAAHFASFLVSEPYRKAQENIRRGFRNQPNPNEAVSFAYVRALLVAAEQQPVVGPADIKGRDLMDGIDLGASTFAFRRTFELQGAADDEVSYDVTRRPGTEVANLLSQMKNLFNFDVNAPDSAPPSTPPLSDDVAAVTSFRLTTKEGDEALRRSRFVSLTMMNVMSATLDLTAFDESSAVDVPGLFQGLLDNVARECSKANYAAELEELEKIKRGGRTLVPVDLDAFQRRTRTSILNQLAHARSGDPKTGGDPREAAALQEFLGEFDAVQALK
jgi:hypothetical protein